MLAGGMVEPGGGEPAMLSAYVVLAAGINSRVFKVKGSASAPHVVELSPATTIDMGAFERQVEGDLAPLLVAGRMADNAVSLATPDDVWMCDLVRDHIKASVS
ncbi:MAG: hypothetical protein JWM74_6012 [Myxococcaceae bacterium]|jgi:hypothetical protein|nr:hypothetical protein [Myxococcaceae bacterium]